MVIKKIGVFVILILLTLGLTGCNRYISSSVQPEQTGLLLLDQQTSLGQTFTARFDGLSGVGLVIKQGEQTTGSGAGEIILHLRKDPQANQDIRTVSLPVQKIAAMGSYRFFFPPLPDSNQQDYYLLLEMSGDSAVQVGIAGNETYLDGAVYQNGTAHEGQLTFNLKYDSVELVSGLLKEIPIWLLWLLVGLFLFVLPGWGMLGALWTGWNELDFLEKFSLGSGASLAIYPVLFLWTNLVGVHLGPFYAWLPAVAGLAFLFWRNFQTVRSSILKNRRAARSDNKLSVANSTPAPRLTTHTSFEGIAPKIAVIILSGAVIFSRLWVIRSLDFPLWGDSYQHTMIAQLMVDNRGLFQSWLPYAELSTFTYHFGFHTLVACFNWISGLPMEKAVLWVGQIVNILAVFCLYPLAKKLGKNRWSGAILLLIAGLVSPMPMSYLNWGRYAQLAAQTILPTAVYCTWYLIQSGQLARRSLVVNWIIVAGLALTHYRVLIYYLLFLIALIFMNLPVQPLAQQIKKIFWSTIGGALIFLPWMITIAPHSILHNLIGRITGLSNPTSSFLTEYNQLGNPLEFLPAIIWFSLSFIIGWMLWRREKDFTIIFLWWYLIFLAANPQIFGLPGEGVINNFSIEIGFYIPAGIIISAALARAIGGLVNWLKNSEWFSSRLKNILNMIFSTIILASVIALSFPLTGQRIDDIKPIKYALMTRPDERAMRWILQNTNSADRFLVNSFFTYGDSFIVGSDGGWWLSLLTKRISTQPPLNYGDEEGLVPDDNKRIKDLIELIEQKGLSDSGVLNTLREHGVKYIYIGQQQGHVNSPQPLLDINKIQKDARFQLVYRQDQIWIFSITQPTP